MKWAKREGLNHHIEEDHLAEVSFGLTLSRSFPKANLLDFRRKS